jgi:uncharacterized protein with HEPN domain
MTPEQQAYLHDILDAARLVREYTAGMTGDEFLADIKTQDAVLRRFEVIGEAAAHLTDETRALFPDVPFHQMRGMRNIIAHVYGEVDLTIVWRTVREHLPGLIAHVAGHPPEAD